MTKLTLKVELHIEVTSENSDVDAQDIAHNLKVRLNSDAPFGIKIIDSSVMDYDVIEMTGP